MPDNDKAPLKRLRTAAAKAGVARQSPLYRWMWANHRALVGMLGEVGSRPNWTAMASEFAALGLTDATESKPTAKIARQTWWKVCRAEEKRARSAGSTAGSGASASVSAPALAPARAPPPVPMPTPTREPPPEPSARNDAARLQRRLASLRGPMQEPAPISERADFRRPVKGEQDDG